MNTQNKHIKAHEGYFKEESYVRNFFCYTCASTHTIENIQAPEYWVNVARHLKPFDEITVINEDGSFVAKLMVTRADRFSVKTKLIDIIYMNEQNPAGTEDAPVEDDFKIVYRGANYKHSIKRTSDNQIIKEGFALKDEAEAWLKDYRKALAA